MIGLLRRRPRALLALPLVLALGVAAGCGDEGVSQDADLANGKALFTSLCASCHILEDAVEDGAPAGRTGPNLDDAFRASREAGIPESTFEGVTRRWISIAQPPMPRDMVTGQDAVDVSAYVASVAGTGEESLVVPPREPGPEPRPPVPVERDPVP